MYLKAAIPQDRIPKKVFAVIKELCREKRVYVNVYQSKGFFYGKDVDARERILTNCWVEVSTSPLPTLENPTWEET